MKQPLAHLLLLLVVGALAAESPGEETGRAPRSRPERGSLTNRVASAQSGPTHQYKNVLLVTRLSSPGIPPTPTTVDEPGCVLARSNDSMNLLKNSGFEEDGQVEWMCCDFGPQFGVDWNATDQSHGGKRSLKLWSTQMSDTPNRWEMAGARQIFPIRPGQVINGGAWLRYENLREAEVFIECKWLDLSQQELGSGIGTVHRLRGTRRWEYESLDIWSVQERTAPKGTAFVDFRLIFLSAGTADRSTGTAWWDDAEFTIQ